MSARRPLRAWLRAASSPRLLLLLLAALCTLVALQRPQLLLARPLYRFVVAVDVTESMNVADVGTAATPMTRIALARQALMRALLRLECGSEVGLALFAEHRTLLLLAPVEVCEHYGMLVEMIERMSWQLAWRGGSEIARGLESSLRIVQTLGEPTRLAFLTDGHEVPPVHPELRMHLDGLAGADAGLIVGIGGDQPVPVPVLDERGRVTGYFGADQVPQVDVYSRGRPGSLEAEPMAGADHGEVERPGAQGAEHLSSLRSAYLQELAQESGLRYARLTDVDDLGALLQQSQFAHRRRVSAPVGWMLALAALAALLAAPFAR